MAARRRRGRSFRGGRRVLAGDVRPAATADSPPVVREGKPIVGNLLGFALGKRGPLDFIERNYHRCRRRAPARVNATRARPRRRVFPAQALLDAAGSQMPDVRRGAQDRRAVLPEPRRRLQPARGLRLHDAGLRKGVVSTRRAKRKAQNVNMSRGLRADRLKSYVPKILRETEAYFAEKWGESARPISS